MFVSINYPRPLNLLLGEAVTAKRNDAAFHEGCGLAPTDGIARAAPDPAPRSAGTGTKPGNAQ